MEERARPDEAQTADGLTRPAGVAAATWTLLLALSGIAWLLVVRQAGAMSAGPGTMGMAPLLFLGMWTVMMAAMMWPALTPLAVKETTAGAASLPANRATLRAVWFATGFLLPWAVYGVLAFAALLGTARLVEAAPTPARWLGVAILAAAGIYQLTPAKARALRHCRTPSGHHPGVSGMPGAFGSGLRDGAFCVGCCWAFMAVFLAVGVMNVGAMVALAAVIFGEKLLPERAMVPFTRAISVAFLLLAVVAAFRPSILPGLHGSGAAMSGMGAGGM
jgi:predicted metal-binding membrane protein